jgi:hypothetical protein
VLVKLPDISDRLSLKLRSDYEVPTATLAMVTLLSVLATVAATGLMVTWQIRAECLDQLAAEAASKARRLRYLANDQEAKPIAVGNGRYHIFLSHVWGSGQDTMRIIKSRLFEMMPDLSIFLDVDNLEDTSDLKGYIERAQTVLIFCSEDYFTSKNCMIEFRSVVMEKKPIIALIDSDASHGGLTPYQVRERLNAVNASHAEWGFDFGPRGDELLAALFADEPIEWNRLSVFQDVTLRLIAARVLQHSRVAPGGTYVQGELSNKKLQPLRSPAHENGYHVYCSPHNAGALELVQEMAAVLSMNPLATESIDNIAMCDHMLVYLTALTWTSGNASAAFAKEVEHTMNAGVHILLAHEMSGCRGQEARHGCEFIQFFTCEDGATPGQLLHRGIYSEIAVALKGVEWRKVSMVLLAQALAAGAEAAEPEPEDVGLRLRRRMAKTRRVIGHRLGLRGRLQLRRLHLSV